MRISPKKAGFSLVETLAVMAIFALLSALSISAFSGISSSHTTGRAAYDLAGLLEFARSEAATRQTYVWVGVENAVDGDGNSEVIAGAVYSLDGTGMNTSQSNLGALSKIIRVRNSKLIAWNNLNSAVKAQLTNTTVLPTDITNNTAGIAFAIGPVQFSSKSTITFTPRGEVLRQGSVGPDDTFDPSLAISFQATRGKVTPQNAEEASVIVNGATGRCRILR